MKTYYELFSQPVTTDPCVISLGFFDGVHRGHSFLLSRGAKEAQSLGAHRVVISFSSLGRVSHRQIITTFHKRRLLDDLGIDILVELDFAQVRSLSPFDFASLVQLMFPHSMWVVGEDIHFGAGGTAGKEFLSAFFKGNVHIVEPLQRQELSSTNIRRCIEAGDLEQASFLLGRPYSIIVPVKDVSTEHKIYLHSLCLPMSVQWSSFVYLNGSEKRSAKICLDCTKKECVLEMSEQSFVTEGQALYVEIYPNNATSGEFFDENKQLFNWKGYANTYKSIDSIS